MESINAEALCVAISEGHGDAAMALLKAGAENDKRDENDNLAIDLAPEKKVIHTSLKCPLSISRASFPPDLTC